MSKGGGVVVVVSEDVLADLSADADAFAPRETGGILMGNWHSARMVQITTAIGSGPKARHTRTSFTPDYDFQEAEVRRIYLETEGRVTYLGDWHSHPGGLADLSDRDRETLARISKSEEARAERALMAILGPGDPWTARVWCGRMTRRRWWSKLEVVELELEIATESHRRFE